MHASEHGVVEQRGRGGGSAMKSIGEDRVDFLSRLRVVAVARNIDEELY
jgi:hypothetical protein